VTVEDTMFFPRLRRQAKWVFLFLALVFGLGFVGFGVGAGGVGVGDIFRGTGDAGVPSVSEAEERLAENPRDPQAFRDLATAYQADGDTDGAIDALEGLVSLRPKNADALRELAGLYLAKASEAQQRAQIAQFRAAYLAPAASIPALAQLGDKVLEPDPITNAVSTRLSNDIQVALFEAQDASGKAVEMYRRIAAASPNEPSVQLELAQAAEGAGDYTTAAQAYETFLRLAPEDPTAPEVRRILRELRQRTGATG
jgi:cytochrome c-type biogenesis protein CcmH/NrfG